MVVGVDGSKASAKAIDFAFDQAEALRARVVALHAWTSPFLTYADGASMLQFDAQKIEDEARLLVAESVAGAAADHPDVQWTTELVTGSAAQALVRRAESADLVVVGSRGRGGFTGLLTRLRQPERPAPRPVPRRHRALKPCPASLRRPRMLAEQATAVRRAVLVPAQLTDWVPRACAEVAAYLFRRGIPPSGYPVRPQPPGARRSDRGRGRLPGGGSDRGLRPGPSVDSAGRPGRSSRGTTGRTRRSARRAKPSTTGCKPKAPTGPETAGRSTTTCPPVTIWAAASRSSSRSSSRCASDPNSNSRGPRLQVADRGCWCC